MKREELEKIFEPNTEDSSLLYDVCEFVYPGKGDKYSDELLLSLNSPLDAFFNSYMSKGDSGEYNMTRLKALLKLIFMINSEKGFINGRKRSSLSIRSSTLEDLLDFMFLNYEMIIFEKMLLVLLKKKGNIACVLESNSNDTESCFISYDDLYPVLSANQGETFLLIHSHPYGDTTPSISDEHIYKYMKKLFSFMNCNLFDEIIVGCKDGKPVYSGYEHPISYYKDVKLLSLIG